MRGIEGASGAMALCITMFLFGAFAVGLPQWITDGIMAVSGVGLIYATRAWRRAVRGDDS